MRDHGYKMGGLVLGGLLLAVLGNDQVYAQQVGTQTATAVGVEKNGEIIDHKTEFKLTEGQERQLRSLRTELAEVRSRQRARLAIVTHELTEFSGRRCRWSRRRPSVSLSATRSSK